MPMKQNELGMSLSRATRIVRSFASGNLSAAKFVEDYANFYYYEALDGHETSSAHSTEDERQRFWIAIELHRRIQIEVVNLMLLDSPYSRSEILAAGRIDEAEARERARQICVDKGLDAILEILQN